MPDLQVSYWEAWESPTDRWATIVVVHPATGVYSVWHTADVGKVGALPDANPERGSLVDFIGLGGWVKHPDDFLLEQAAVKFARRIGPHQANRATGWRRIGQMFSSTEQPPDDPANPFDQDDNGFAARLRRHVRRAELGQARTPDSAGEDGSHLSGHIWLTAPSYDGGKFWHGYVQALVTGKFVPVVHIGGFGSEGTPGTRNQVGAPMSHDEAIELITTRAARKLGKGYVPKAEQ